MSEKTHEFEILTSDNFENDPNSAVDALAKTGFAVFMVSKQWFQDERAKKEWRFANDSKKPLVYIFRDMEEIVKEPMLSEMMTAPTLIGTINHYGDSKTTGTYLSAMHLWILQGKWHQTLKSFADFRRTTI